MKRVRYKVTGVFGNSPEGEIRYAYALTSTTTGEPVLLFHPPSKNNACASLEFAKWEQGVYVSVADETYVNLDTKAYTKRFMQSVADIDLSVKSEGIYSPDTD